MNSPIRHTAIFCFALLGAFTASAQEQLYGDIGCHDPSSIIKEGSRYYFFRTGADVPYVYSDDLRIWTSGGTIFPDGPPAWVDEAVPNNDPNNWNWAPDVAYFNGKYHVYYSSSEWGTIDSAIGVASSPSLASPNWTDLGKVVQSDALGYETADTDTTGFNCIDPSVLVDSAGSVWLTFGSYSSGILITEIDPETGLRKNTSTLNATLVANNSGNRGWGSSVEGASTYQHGDYYYLFVNYGGCCSGVDSTYNIRVGRSSSATGPYYDKNGVDMRDGGGTMFLESSGLVVGPGHAGILNDNGTEWFSYHYYTWTQHWSQLGITKLTWDADDWPVLANDWSAFYPFNKDAREHSDWFDGSLQDGASVVSDDTLGSALELDGTGYALLDEPVANCSTITTWVKWDGGAVWQRIFDFGAGTTNYMFLTPEAWNNGMRFAIRENNGAEQIVETSDPLLTNTWCHVAVTLDGNQGILYLNGDAVASNSITIRPWELMARSNYVGKSQWPDPGFEGRVASFRAFAHALSAEEIKTLARTHPALAHRYNFASGVEDPIGKANGKLKGTASIVNEKLHLTGTTGCYAQLPGGLISGCGTASIEFWADLRSNGNWARIFDFGNYVGAYGNSFLFLTPGLSSSQYRMDMNGSVIDVTGTLNNRSSHVVCIIDPDANYKAIYVNGVRVAYQTASMPAFSTIGKEWSFLGRSLFSADAYLNGDIDEFRIYDGRLSAAEISAHYLAGPDQVDLTTEMNWSSAGQSFTFEWPTFPAGYGIEYTTALNSNTVWQALERPLPGNGIYQQTISSEDIGENSAFFRLSL